MFSGVGEWSVERTYLDMGILREFIFGDAEGVRMLR
jgi:hypothetical protein